MKFIHKALALFLCLAFFSGLVPAGFAEEFTEEDLAFTYVDPIYTDVFTEDMIREHAAEVLSSPSEDAGVSDPLSLRDGRDRRFFGEETVVYDTFEEAAAALHDQIKAFTESMSTRRKTSL